MEELKKKFAEKGSKLRDEVKKIRKEYGDEKLGEYTVGQAYNGMKGIKGLVYETSALDPEEGIRFRGYSIPEIRKYLPKAEQGVEPLPEGIFHLMLLDELPEVEDVRKISKDWYNRSAVPNSVFQTLDSLPTNTHPMTQFSIAILAMQSESEFSKSYREGIHKDEMWAPVYEDVMNLIARLPRIAAYIYQRTYHQGKKINPDPELDWAANFSKMMGFDPDSDFKRMARLYLTILADHEGGNVSAHTNRLVGSALSDPYFSFSAAMNGLAGPLHGLANQEVLRWLMNMRNEIGKDQPSKKELQDYVKKTLGSGQVIPGYGHAVLRKTDPRFVAQQDFAKNFLPDDPLVKTVDNLHEIVPPILQETGKVSNPWPNVDAYSGALFLGFGLKEYDFYTVMFGVSRALGTCTSLIIDRMVQLPIERPKSVTTQFIKEELKLTSSSVKN